MTAVDANGVRVDRNPLWSRLACHAGGALIGVSLVVAAAVSLLGLVGVAVGAALFVAGLYPHTQVAYWREADRVQRRARAA